jgi:outer membrane lipoprotein carrier protein
MAALSPSGRLRLQRCRRFSLWLLLAAFTPVVQAADSPLTAPVLASRIDHHYNALHSLQEDFVQRYDGMGMHRKESGVLLLKKAGSLRLSGKMRWTYSDPAGKLFVLDGHDGYFYSPGSAEAQRIPAKNLDDLHSPLRFLLGHTELEKELTGLQMTPAPDGDFTLSGIPKGMEQRIAAFSITASAEGTIHSMKIDGVDGVVNTFTFTAERPNVPVTDADFVFTLPPGVHIITGISPM